jgi:nucleotide-binding universal stress UspA family protein
MYKHILIPTDGSKLSDAAAVAGVKLAKALGAKVTAFFAPPPATPIEYKGLFPSYIDPKEHAKAIEKATRKNLEFIERAAKAAGVRCASASVTSDYPADAIVAAAKRYGCDLIYMASHGHRGFRSSNLGTQTQKVAAQSKISVLMHR